MSRSRPRLPRARPIGLPASPLLRRPAADASGPGVGRPAGRRRFVPTSRVLVTVTGAEDATLRGMVLNLSGGGFCGQLHGPPLEPTDRVTTRVSPFGRKDVLEAAACVVWRRPELASGAVQYGFSWLEGGDLPEILAMIPAPT